MRTRIAHVLFIGCLICMANGIPLVARAASIFVDFNKYADFTPVSNFSEPGLTFASNGIGIARALGGQLQIDGGGASVTITLAQPASDVQFDYSLSGPCSENAAVQLFSGTTLVDQVGIGYCDPGGLYQRSVGFDSIVITTFGVSSSEDIRVDNLGITIPGAPTTIPTLTFTNTPLPTATSATNPFPKTYNYFVTFDQYPDFTPVSDFAEPNLTFSSNGIGIARALGGALQIGEGGAGVTITTARIANAVEFDYSLAGSCSENAVIELFSGTSLVDSISIGYCAPAGVYRKGIRFDRIVITTPGVSNAEEIHIDNIGINIPNGSIKPSNTPKPSKTP